eukprot:UN26078
MLNNPEWASLELNEAFWVDMFHFCERMEDSITALELIDDCMRLGINPPIECLNHLFNTLQFELPLEKIQELYFI